MNILFISANSPEISVGGVERHITNLISYYKNRTDCQTCLILPAKTTSYIETIGNITIYHEESLSIPRDYLRHKKLIGKNAQILTKLIEMVITKHTIDVICAENIIFGSPAVYTLFLNMVATVNKIPLILRLHSFPTTDLQKELVNQLMWDKISCVSQSVAGDCFQKGTDIDLLSTHYLGVNSHEFCRGTHPLELRKQLAIEPNAKIVVTATRIINGAKNILKEKGIISLIRAFSKLSSRYEKLYLLIAVGTPPQNLHEEFDQALEMLTGYLKLHSIEKKTIVRSFKLGDMPSIYQNSDIFVLTSENETFGQVFIEAMSCGIPVIGTKVGGIPEIISDSYNGYLVQPDDASILAQRIEKLLTDKNTRDSFVQAGLKTVNSKFTAEKQFTDFHSMLEEVVVKSR